MKPIEAQRTDTEVVADHATILYCASLLRVPSWKLEYLILQGEL